MPTGACEFCDYEHTADKAVTVLNMLRVHTADVHGLRLDGLAQSMVSSKRPKSNQVEEHMTEATKIKGAALTGSFTVGKETANYRRLESKAMGDGDMFGSLYILPASLPEGATKVNVTVSFE